VSNSVEKETNPESAARILSAAESAAEHHSVYCPTCSSRLFSRRCKLICANCGYYLSCADYY